MSVSRFRAQFRNPNQRDMINERDARLHTRKQTFPDGPKGARLAILLLAHWKNPLGLWLELAEQYGDIVHFSVGTKHVFFLRHPDAIKDVLVTHQANFARGVSYRFGKEVWGEGLLSSDGEFHHRQRRLLQAVFHHSRLSTDSKVMTAYAEQLSDRWREGAVVDIEEDMRLLSAAILCKAVFAVDPEGEGAELNKAVPPILKFLEFSHLLALPFGKIIAYVPLPGPFRFRKAIQRLDRAIYALIETRLREGAPQGDLFSMLIDGTMTDVQLRDEVASLFFAGHETIAKALTWTWYLLSQHPEAEHRLHLELETVLAGRVPTAEDLARLPYTAAVVAESLRLYPPVFGIGRRVCAEQRLDGVVLPGGSSVIICPYVTHRDPRFFPDPLRFDPSRWHRATRPVGGDAYIPFGAGIRRCLGEHYARTEMILLIATLAQRWRLRPIPGRPVEPLGRLTLKPRFGMQMQLERRIANDLSKTGAENPLMDKGLAG